jgi:asparagine synthase (glutamine-hydrolysing)
MLYEKNRGKLPLRSILSKFVPSELFERPKSGFGIPVGAWLRSELAEWAEDLLNDQSIKSSEFFDSRQINTIWNNHKANTSDNTVKLWNILMFISWFRNNNS